MREEPERTPSPPRTPRLAAGGARPGSAGTADLGRERPASVRAYDLYLKGRESYSQYTSASLHKALELFRQATEIDPEYAMAWAGIADSYGQFLQWGDVHDTQELARLGLEAAEKAIRHARGTASRFSRRHSSIARK